MSYRLALAVSSALAALVISTIATHLLLWDLKPGRIEEISLWRIHVLTVFPATIAAAVSGAWSPGWRYWARLDAVGQALWILLNSYIVYGLFIVALFGFEWSRHNQASSLSALDSIGLTLMSGGLMMFAAMIVTGLPALMAEYMIVRFVSRRWQPALSTEVAP